MQLPAKVVNAFVSLRAKKGIAVWAAMALFVVLMGIVFLEFHKRSRSLGSQAIAKRSQIRIARDSGLTEIGAVELAKLQSGVASFKNGFIRSAELPAMLDGVSDAAARNGVRVISLDSEASSPAREPSDSEGRPSYRRMPIHIRLEGTTSSLGNFLYTLENSSKRLFVVESLSLRKAEPGSTHLDADLTLSFFSQGG